MEANRLAKGKPLESGLLSMYEDFTTNKRESIYAIINNIDNLPKITWCLFDDSYLIRSINNLNH